MKGCELSKVSLILIILVLIAISPSNAHLNSRIIELCPNPYGDEGAEYVKIFCNAECILSDGEGSVEVGSGIFTIAKNPLAFYKLFGYMPDIEASGKFALSNSGEEVVLIENNSIVDSFTYGEDGFGYVDEGVVYFRTNGSWDFRYQDWTSFLPAKDYVTGRIIVSPTSYSIDAKKELIIASYTLTDLSLLELSSKGVRVEVFLDANPVGGVPIEEIEIARKVRVHFLKSDSFKNFHYKFAIVDDRKVIITTENWKWDKRGYIVEFESKKAVNLLKEVLKHDLLYESNMGKTGEIKGLGNSGVVNEFRFSGEVEVFILPDYNPIFDTTAKAKRRLYIQAPYLDFRWFNGTPLLDAILQAARNGADVKILLGSKYNAERNQKTAEFLNEIAKQENLRIEAKLIKLGDFKSLHAKMIVADNESIITSANFNKYGLKLNREVGVVIYSKEASNFLAEKFVEDWNGKSFEVSYAIPVAILLAFALFVAYRGLKG
jgi:hypothetical protein